MTTLQLAEKVAQAVFVAMCPDQSKPYGDAPAQAVLQTLEANNAWFCRLTVETLPDGTAGETQQELFERV